VSGAQTKAPSVRQRITAARPIMPDAGPVIIVTFDIRLWLPIFFPVYVLLAPAQDHRIQRTRQFQQTFAGIGMQGRERVSNGVGLDHSTIKHGRFGGSQAALTVLVVYQWQNTSVL